MNSENTILQAGDTIKNIRKAGELEEAEIKANIERLIDKEKEIQKTLQERITGIELKLEKSKGSLYGWLNEQVPGWQDTIGKVIDEDRVLFQESLNPRKIKDAGNSFYGISIDLQEIKKTVKTVADYQDDKVKLLTQLDNSKKATAQLDARLADDLDKLKRKLQPKIKEQKQLVLNNEFNRDKYRQKADELGVRLSDWLKAAAAKKESELLAIEEGINRLKEEKMSAAALVNKVEDNIARQLNAKRKEKDKKHKTRHQEYEQQVEDINKLIELKRQLLKENRMF